MLSPIDALRVINFLNARSALDAQGEGEGEGLATLATPPVESPNADFELEELLDQIAPEIERRWRTM